MRSCSQGRILDDTIAALYEQGYCSREIGLRVSLTARAVRYRLESMDIARRAKGARYGHGKCVECGVQSAAARRCPKHQRLHKAEISRNYRRRKYGIPRNRWKLAF